MPKKKLYEPIKAICKDCEKDFVITPEEQNYYKSMQFELPKRCPDCRKVRRAAKKAEEAKEIEKKQALEKEEQKKKWEADEKELEAILKKIRFHQIKIDDIVFNNPSSTLVVIGNGFDIMHGAHSSYWDFQKTIGKKSSLRFYMETYLDTGDLWSNLEDSLGRLNYSMFLNPDVIDMWLDNYGAYDPEAQAADFFAAVETAIAPCFEIPRELKKRFKSWVKTLTVNGDSRPFVMFHGDYKVLNFNYTEFIECLYGAKRQNICYIHGCRKPEKSGQHIDLILGHRPGIEDEQWDKVELKPFRFKNPHKRYIMEAALETAAREAAWYDESTIKNCEDIIKNHKQFFDGLSEIKEVYVIGHSLAEVDYPYFKEICKANNAKWHIGFHSLDDMKRLLAFVKEMKLSDVTVFRT